MNERNSRGRPEASPARRRLLDTATRLFYEGGIHAVGIDRIIAEAGVAKATFYYHFPAKDELVRAYLEAEYQRQRHALEAVTQILERRSPGQSSSQGSRTSTGPPSAPSAPASRTAQQ